MKCLCNFLFVKKTSRKTENRHEIVTGNFLFGNCRILFKVIKSFGDENSKTIYVKDKHKE